MRGVTGRLRALEERTSGIDENARLSVPDCGPIDTIGWPTTPAGWAVLVTWAVTDTPDVANQLRIAYAEGQTY